MRAIFGWRPGLLLAKNKVADSIMGENPAIALDASEAVYLADVAARLRLAFPEITIVVRRLHSRFDDEDD